MNTAAVVPISGTTDEIEEFDTKTIVTKEDISRRDALLRKAAEKDEKLTKGERVELLALRHKSGETLSRVEYIELREAYYRNRLKAERAAEKARERKRDARRKIILGGFFAAKMKRDEKFRKETIGALKTALTRKADREVWDFPELTPANAPKKDDPNPGPKAKEKHQAEGEEER